MKQNSTIIIKQLAELLNLTQRAVEKQVAKLKDEEKVGRAGGAKKGNNGKFWRMMRGSRNE